MTGRVSGFRHAIDYARHARNALAAGKVGPAVIHWGHARCHFGFTVGLTEGIEKTFAARMLREALNNIGTAIEAAVSARVPVQGWEVAQPVLEAMSPLLDAHPDIGVDALGEIAVQAGAAISRRWEVRERSERTQR